MHTVNKCDFIQPRIQYTGQNVALEYVFVNNKGNNKITELRTILQRESQNS